MRSSHKGITRFFIYIITFLLVFSSNCPVQAATPDMPVPSSAGAVLMEASTSQIFRQENEDMTCQPYGSINLLIALTAYRHADLNDSVIVPEGMEQALPEDAYVVFLEEGEELTVEDCIGALLFNSANDAAYTLAVHLAGSIEAFTEWMNNTAVECGAVSSHFSTVYDLSAENHYTTAKDMAKIAAAFWNELPLRNLLCRDLCSIEPTNITSETRYYANPFKMLGLGTSYYYEYAVGGKCSQGTIIAFAQTESMSLICTVMDAYDSDAAYKAAEDILEFGFDYFQPVTIEYPGNSVARIPVYDQGEKIGYTDALVQGTFLFYAEVLSRKPTDPEGLESFFQHTLLIPDSLQAPIHAGDKIGEVVYTRLDDPSVQIHMDCIASSTFLPIQDESRSGNHTPGRLAKGLMWVNLLLIVLILIIAWRLLSPWIRKKLHKPKLF